MLHLFYKPFPKWPLFATLCIIVLGACASIAPNQAVHIAQPDNPPIRNFTSFSAALRCMDKMLTSANRPKTLISSTGFPDLSKKVTVGADEMLVNAVNQMNLRSRAYVFIDQSLEKDWGQIDLLTPQKENLRPNLYIRAAVTQVDKGVVSDSGTLNLDFTNAPKPWNPFKADLKKTKFSAGREVAVITVDMHLVSFPDKTIIPGSSVANSMVVVTDKRGFDAGGLIRLTGFDFSIKINRVESLGQAVRNLAELGTIELLGRHSRVPYWKCLNIRPSNQKLDNLDQKRFAATARPTKIKQIQTFLNRLGYLSRGKTGVLDIKTRKAIGHFQADEKLIASGEINYQLFTLLQEKANGFNRNRTPFPRKPKPPALLLTPDRQKYRKGDTLQLSLAVQKDGYVSCFHQTDQGPIVQILPALTGKVFQVSDGATLNVPNKHANFDIKFETRNTEEAVLCILVADKGSTTKPTILTRGPLKSVSAHSFQEIIAIYRQNRRGVAATEFRIRSR